jgi:hypothetical protein
MNSNEAIADKIRTVKTAPWEKVGSTAADCGIVTVNVLVGAGYGGVYDVEVKRTDDGRVAAVRVVFV